MAFFWVAGAIVGGAVIGAVGSNMAASKQAAAQNRATDIQQGMFGTIQQQNQPFLQSGYDAMSNLNDLMGTSGNTTAQGYGSLTKPFTAADYTANADPGYQFQLQQGSQAVRNADTPKQGALSGSTLKDLMSYNQGVAATGYQNAFNRYTTNQSNIYARLSGIAGLGQNAASNTGTAGVALGTGAAQATAAAGGAQAGGIVGASNSLAGGANSLSGLMYMNGLNATGNTGTIAAGTSGAQYSNLDTMGQYTMPSVGAVAGGG